MISRYTIKVLFTVIAGLFFASSGYACSVCVVGKEEARTAYYATTAILSFLPLIMIGGLIYYVVKKNR